MRSLIVSNNLSATRSLRDSRAIETALYGLSETAKGTKVRSCGDEAIHS